MNLTELKAKLKGKEAQQSALRNEAKAILDKYPGDAAMSVEDLKTITAKHDEAGKFTAEIAALQNAIAHEEGLEIPNPRKGVALNGELDSTAEDFQSFAAKIRGVYGKPKFIQGDGTTQGATKMAHRFGTWLAAQCVRGTPGQKGFSWARNRCKELFGANAVHQEDGMTSGGNLVPPEFIWELINLKETFGKFRQNTRVVPMSEDTLQWPRRSGGLGYYWVGEGGQGTTSTMVIDMVKLVAKKLMILAVTTRELSEDAAMSIGDILMAEAAYQMSSAEDDAGFLGDGTSTYGGITGIGNKLLALSGTIANISGLQVATGTGYATSYGATVLADFQKVIGLLPLYADGPACKWYMNRSYYFSVAQVLAAAAGGTTWTEIINGHRVPMFLGYPVEFVQKMPKSPAVSQVTAIFGNLPLGSKMGDRRQYEIAESEDATIDGVNLFTNDMRAFRATQRIDINIHDVGNASGTASSRQAGPIVAMITAAS